MPTYQLKKNKTHQTTVWVFTISSSSTTTLTVWTCEQLYNRTEKQNTPARSQPLVPDYTLLCLPILVDRCVLHYNSIYYIHLNRTLLWCTIYKNNILLFCTLLPNFISFWLPVYCEFIAFCKWDMLFFHYLDPFSFSIFQLWLKRVTHLASQCCNKCVIHLSERITFKSHKNQTVCICLPDSKWEKLCCRKCLLPATVQEIKTFQLLWYLSALRAMLFFSTYLSE